MNSKCAMIITVSWLHLSDRYGFSLIEMLVAIGTMIVLSGVMLGFTMEYLSDVALISDRDRVERVVNRCAQLTRSRGHMW